MPVVFTCEMEIGVSSLRARLRVRAKTGGKDGCSPRRGGKNTPEVACSEASFSPVTNLNSAPERSLP